MVTGSTHGSETDRPIAPLLDTARAACDRATFDGDGSGLDDAARDMDAVAAAVSLARGRLLHARHLLDSAASVDPTELDLFEEAVQLFARVGDSHGEAEALFWVGCFHQVVRGDHAAAERALLKSASLAREHGDHLTLSYALRHQGIAAHMSGDLERADRLLRESTALRRADGFAAGVAANLVGLAYISSAQGHADRAKDLLGEAAEIADGAAAHAIRAQVDQARKDMGVEA